MKVSVALGADTLLPRCRRKLTSALILHCIQQRLSRHEGVPMLDIRFAGLAPDFVPYLDGWELQREVHRDVVAGTRRDTLLLLEHEAVYTAGKRTEPQERPQDGTPVVDV